MPLSQYRVPHAESDIARAWARVRTNLRESAGARLFDQWLKPIALAETGESDRVRLTLPSAFMTNWVRNHYAERLVHEFRAIVPAVRSVVIETATEAPAVVTLSAVPAAQADQFTGGWANVRLEDLASRHPAVMVPDACLTRVGASEELLVQIGPGQLRPVSVTPGMRADGYVEVVDGLSADDTVVIDLTDLAAEVQEIRALLIGFWTPNPRALTTLGPVPSSNPLLA